MQCLSAVWGCVAMLGLLLGLLLWFWNYVNIPFAIIGIVLSAIGLAGPRRSYKGGAVVGLILCALAAAFGMLRLALRH